MSSHHSHFSVTSVLWVVTKLLFVMKYISFLQSSTAVFLAALPAPPLLKITGRVSQR